MVLIGLDGIRAGVRGPRRAHISYDAAGGEARGRRAGDAVGAGRALLLAGVHQGALPLVDLRNLPPRRKVPRVVLSGVASGGGGGGEMGGAVAPVHHVGVGVLIREPLRKKRAFY